MSKKELQKLEYIIQSRFNLETNRRAIEKYGLSSLDLSVNKYKVAAKYNELDKLEKRRFIELVGGYANKDETRQYLESFILKK